MIDASVLELVKLLLPVVASIAAAWFAFLAKRQTDSAVQHVVDLKVEQQVIKEDVHRVEVATNSMKDALVLSEKAKSLAEGKALEKQEQAVRDVAATEAKQEGVAQEQKDQAMRDTPPKGGAT